VIAVRVPYTTCPAPVIVGGDTADLVHRARSSSAGGPLRAPSPASWAVRTAARRNLDSGPDRRRPSPADMARPCRRG